ncbi:DUF1073 domain-containing protein [bacterium]|nr:DUF1073 domain-containing protein [bacterium]
MNLKDKFNNYIKNIAREVLNEKQATTDEFSGNYALPEIDRNNLLAKSIQKTHKDLVASVPVGVAMDACCNTDKFNDYYNISNPVDDIIYTHFATQCFIGFQACAILTQNWLINKACLLPTKDAIRPDYELSYVTTDETEVIDKDFLTKITDLSNDAKKFNIKEVARTFAEKKRQFGQCLAYPIVEGADYSNPFNIDSIKPDSYKGMTVIDPVWYQAILDDEAISDPTSLRYMKPTYFQMPNGVKVHHSWCIFNTNGDVPDILKPTYRWGGYPIPQLIYKRAYAAEKTANEAPMLAQSKRLLITDINPKNYFVNQRETEEQLKVLCNFRDNFGVMTKRPGESVQQIDTSLTDLDEVIMTQFQLTAAAAGITATKLLETQPKGFNSTGDYEDKNYKLTCVSIQKEDYIPILDFHYRLLSMSKYGIKRDYTINFKEIDTPTEKERAEINEIKARTDATYIDAGILTQDEVRDNLIKSPNSDYADISNDIDEEYPEEEQGGSETSQSPFKSQDKWEEGDPRRANGQFGEGSGESSSENYKPSERHNRVKNRPRKSIRLPYNEHKRLETAIFENQFNDKEKESGVAIRFTSDYKYMVKIDNADDLSYTVIQRWKNT